MNRAAAAAAAVVALLAIPLAWCASTGNTGGDYYSASGHRVGLRISDASIGILARSGATEAAVAAFAEKRKLQIAQKLPGGVYILGLGEAASRRELLDRAERLRKADADLVMQAGLVARSSDRSTPVLVSNQVIVQLKPGAGRKNLEKLASRQQSRIVNASPFVAGLYLLQADDSSLDALALAQWLERNSSLVAYAQPNFVRAILPTQAPSAAQACEPVNCTPEIQNVDPNDPDGSYVGRQWHHRNAGQCNGLRDADIDTPRAWSLASPSSSPPAGAIKPVVVAVLDTGFDLDPGGTILGSGNFTLWTNPGELSDHDGDEADTGPYPDDMHGWDFHECDGMYSGPMPTTSCGRSIKSTGTEDDDHGTSVAGLVAAKGVSDGITGSCPDCRLMLLRAPFTDYAQALAFGYAEKMGADIINNSWQPGWDAPPSPVVANAIRSVTSNGRNGLGSVVLFSMANGPVDFCAEDLGGAGGQSTAYVSMPEVIAIGTSTNYDKFDTGGAFGDCLDLLAPSAQKLNYENNENCGSSSLWITTTDRSGAPGFNIDRADSQCPSAENPSRKEHTYCFAGNSAATPIAAGVAGLVLEAAPQLKRERVQRILQDTADKIEDSAAQYGPRTGYTSAPQKKHGWGRINAFEAVRLAAPASVGGRGNVDVFLRDNRLDWGNTEQPSNVLFEDLTPSDPVRSRSFIPHWESADIKVDAPPLCEDTPGCVVPVDATTFETFVDETPSAREQAKNKAYVRVRNRGPIAATGVKVKLQWTQFSTALPSLPSNFWDAFPADSTEPSDWHPLKCSGSTTESTCKVPSLEYSGASVAATSADKAQIVKFDFPAPPFDPARPNHFCLMAVVDSDQDRPSAIAVPTQPPLLEVDRITPADNNVTHRNYINLSTGASASSAISPQSWQSQTIEFYVRNPTRTTIQTALKVDTPRGWSVSFELSQSELLALASSRPPGMPRPPRSFSGPFKLGPRQKVKIAMAIRAPAAGLAGKVVITQERTIVGGKKVVGGLTIMLRPG